MPESDLDIVFDRISDLNVKTNISLSMAGTEADLPPADLNKIRTKWGEVNARLKKVSKLKESDYVTTNGNKLNFLGAYLKASRVESSSRLDNELATASRASNMVDTEGFLISAMLELAKRLEN